MELVVKLDVDRTFQDEIHMLESVYGDVVQIFNNYASLHITSSDEMLQKSISVDLKLEWNSTKYSIKVSIFKTSGISDDRLKDIWLNLSTILTEKYQGCFEYGFVMDCYSTILEQVDRLHFPDGICPICLEDFSLVSGQLNFVRSSTCGHGFHFNCFIDLSNNYRSSPEAVSNIAFLCPLCNSIVPTGPKIDTTVNCHDGDVCNSQDVKSVPSHRFVWTKELKALFAKQKGNDGHFRGIENQYDEDDLEERLVAHLKAEADKEKLEAERKAKEATSARNGNTSTSSSIASHGGGISPSKRRHRRAKQNHTHYT